MSIALWWVSALALCAVWFAGFVWLAANHGVLALLVGVLVVACLVDLARAFGDDLGDDPLE